MTLLRNILIAFAALALAPATASATIFSGSTEATKSVAPSLVNLSVIGADVYVNGKFRTRCAGKTYQGDFQSFDFAPVTDGPVTLKVAGQTKAGKELTGTVSLDAVNENAPAVRGRVEVAIAGIDCPLSRRYLAAAGPASTVLQPDPLSQTASVGDFGAFQLDESKRKISNIYLEMRGICGPITNTNHIFQWSSAAYGVGSKAKSKKGKFSLTGYATLPRGEAIRFVIRGDFRRQNYIGHIDVDGRYVAGGCKTVRWNFHFGNNDMALFRPAA